MALLVLGLMASSTLVLVSPLPPSNSRRLDCVVLLPHHCFFVFKLNLLGVTLVNKIMKVSGVQFYNYPSAHCVFTTPSQVALAIS